MSGSTIGGVVGGVIGFYVGGGQGAQVGWMIGSAVGGYVDPDRIKGQRLTDAQVQTSAEGVPRAIVYGTAVISGNIIQCGPIVEHETEERTGKGGPVQEGFTYTRTHCIRVCEGPIGGITRIWRDDKLVYDRRDPSDWPDQADAIMAMAADTEKFASNLVVYLGDEEQQPDPTLEGLPPECGGGIGNVPAYRGTCYVVIADDDVSSREGAASQYRFEVSNCGTETPTFTSAPTWYAVAGGTSYAISRTGGTTWEPDAVSSGEVATFVGVVTGNRRILLLESNGGYCSADTGATWTPLTGLPVESIQCGLFAINASQTSGQFVLGHNGTQVSTSFDGINFTYTSIPGFVGSVAAIVQCTTGFFGLVSTKLVALGYKSAVSFDLGTTWENASVGYVFDASHPVTCAAANGTSILAGSVGGLLAFSADAGVSWTPVTSPFLGTSQIVDVLADGNGGYVVRNGDGEVAHGGAGSLALSGFTLVPDGQRTGHAESGVYVLGGSAGELAVSTNGGQTWTLQDNPFTDPAQSIDGIAGPGPLYGYTLPDVPTWTVDNDGNLTGQGGSTLSVCTEELGDIVADICARAGVTAAQIDVSQLTDEVRGFVIGRQLPAADAIRSLQQGYFFDFPEWGNWPDTSTKLRGIKRGGPEVFDITDDDCVHSDDDEDVRAQAVEFPRKINLITSDVDSDYAPTKQTAERRTDNVKAVGELTVELPLAFPRSEAAPKAAIMLQVAWTEAEGRANREVPEDLSIYTPSDCGRLNGKRVRIEKTVGGDGSTKWEMVRDRAGAYTSAATSASARPPTTPASRLRGPTLFAGMNLPSLRTADNVPGLYVAVCGILDGWIGCDLQLSVDEGVTYQSVATIRNEATMGYLTAACDSGATDLISTSILHGHELDAATTAQIAARANAAAIITSGTAEVIQFQTPTETETGYDLSDLTRGELATTAAAHLRGDTFVLLDGRVVFIPIDVAHAGETLYFRPVSIGTVPANNQVYAVLYDPDTEVIVDGGEIT